MKSRFANFVSQDEHKTNVEGVVTSTGEGSPLTDKGKKSIFKRWWFWTLLVVLLLVLLSIVYNEFTQYKQSSTKDGAELNERTRKFNDLELDAANAALAKGIKIEDPKNDFYIIPEDVIEGDGRPNNYNPYPLGYTDLKSFMMAADESYLYIKYEFWDKFPNKLPQYGYDYIWITGPSVEEMLFHKEGKADFAQIITEIVYSTAPPTKDNIVWAAKKAELRNNIKMTPIGLDATGDNIVQSSTRAGMVTGGFGKDYLLSAVPLSVFGLKLGDEIIFSVGDETGSAIYHHESVDHLLQEVGNKNGGKIKYKLGASTYERITMTDYENLPDKVQLDRMIRSGSKTN